MRKYLEANPVDFSLACAMLGLPVPLVEHKFHPVRKWRFDLAWPDCMLAMEIEGGSWIGGRHTRGAGFAEDCIKYAEATLLGWRVLRFTVQQVGDGTAFKYLEHALGVKINR